MESGLLFQKGFAKCAQDFEGFVYLSFAISVTFELGMMWKIPSLSFKTVVRRLIAITFPSTPAIVILSPTLNWFSSKIKKPEQYLLLRSEYRSQRQDPVFPLQQAEDQYLSPIRKES